MKMRNNNTMKVRREEMKYEVINTEIRLLKTAKQKDQEEW